MGLRDIALAIVCFGALPLIPFRPFIGLLVFSWLAYFRPQDLSWVLRSSHFSQYVAQALLLGMLLSVLFPRLLQREKWVTLKTQTVWMIVLWVWVWICCQTAVNPALTERRFDVFTNLIIIAVLTTGLVCSKGRFRLMTMVIGLSLGALGLKYALFGAIHGGVVFTTGPGGFMVDNNSFALCLNMALPLLAGIAFVEERKSIRLLALLLAIGSVGTIILTFSRGGLLTLGAVAVMLVWTPGKRLKAAAVLALLVGGFFLFTDESFQEKYFGRAGSIKNYEEDQSAMGRIEAWGTAIRISKDYPIFGVGPANLYAVHSDYSDNPGVRVTHNSFLQFLHDTGYPGLALLGGLLLVSLHRLQLVRIRYDQQWVRTYARMLQISFVAYIVGASLLDMAYLDLIYHLVGMSVCLEVAAEAPLPAEAGAAAAAPEAKPWYLVESARSGVS